LTVKQKSIIYILGAGHCGSTILDIMLNNNSQVFSVGEIRSIHRYIELLKSPYEHTRIFKGKHSDWLEVFDSPLNRPPWLSIRAIYEEKGSQDFDKLNILEGKFSNVFLKRDKKKWHHWKKDNIALLNAVFKDRQVRFISDRSDARLQTDLCNPTGIILTAVIRLLNILGFN